MRGEDDGRPGPPHARMAERADATGSRGPSAREPVFLWTAVVCAVLFAALACEVALHPGPLPGVESGVRAWAVRHRPPAAAATARAVTATGTGIWAYALVCAAALLAERGTRQRVRAAGAFVLVLACGQAARFGVMEAIARPRPDRGGWATAASGYSFPSGHATTSFLVAGLLCWAASRRTRRTARWTLAISAVWVALVGFTRIYLGVHWVADVLGGWLFAATWLAGAAYLLDLTYRQVD